MELPLPLRNIINQYALELRSNRYETWYTLNKRKEGMNITHGNLIVRDITFFHDDMKEGYHYEYYSDGEFFGFDKFHKGNMVEESRSYYENGQLHTRHTYIRRGVLVYRYYTNGTIATIYLYRE